MSVRVKICGITRVEDAELAVSLGADIIGLNFYPPSSRSLRIDDAQRIRRAIGARCRVAGVFVNAERSYIDVHLRALNLDLLQFHGDESPEALSGWTVEVIRALRLRDDAAPNTSAAGCADYLLLDSFHPKLFGGTGRTLMLDRLKGVNLSRVFISGGLTPDNVGAAVALKPYAVDVASGVESAPGIKDPAKLRSFIINAKPSR